MTDLSASIRENSLRRISQPRHLLSEKQSSRVLLYVTCGVIIKLEIYEHGAGMYHMHVTPSCWVSYFEI